MLKEIGTTLIRLFISIGFALTFSFVFSVMITHSKIIGDKLMVMAEVLSTDSGIGGEITNARLNIETEMVIAWTIIIVTIYFILGGIVKCLKKCRWIRRFWYRSLLARDIVKN